MSAIDKSKIDLPPIRIDRELDDRLRGEVAASFGDLKISDVVRKRLRHSYEAEGNPLPLSNLEGARDEGRRLDNEMKSMKLRQARGELVRRDAVRLAYRKMIMPIRQAFQQVEHAASDLTDQQRAELIKWREDTLTNLSVPRAPIER